MFDSFFKHSFIQNELPQKSDLFHAAKLYRARGVRSNQWYLIRVEQFDHELFAVKFYLKNSKQSKDKYRLLSGLNEATSIIRTCLNIMLEVLEEHPLSSFVIVGMNGIHETNLKRTKRYKIYKRVIQSFFSSVRFEHFDYPQKSTVLLLNREYSYRQDAITFIEQKLPLILDS